MLESHNQKVTIKAIISQNKVYKLCVAAYRGQEYYAKLFKQQIVDKYKLGDILQENIEAFNLRYNDFVFKNHIFPIRKQAQKVDGGKIILIPKYQMRLDKFGSKPNSEQQVMIIAEQILKSIYSLVLEGFTPKNIRPEHFVLDKGIWKLQSFTSQETPKSINCQYTAHRQYATPQSNQQLQYDLKSQIVWDFGSILIDLLLGYHYLKDDLAFNSFKNKKFSFQRAKLKIAEKYSPQLKDMIGQMCHYDYKKRIPLKDLLLSGFFSNQVAHHYQNHLRNSNFDPNSSINSQIDPSPNLPPIYNNPTLKIKQQILSQPLNLEQIKKIFPSDKFSSIFIQTQNMLDKGKILQYSLVHFHNALQLSENKKNIQSIQLLTKYTIKFVKAMDLCKLFMAFNQNVKVYQLSVKEQEWIEFYKNQGVQQITRYLLYYRNKALNQVRNIQQEISQQDETIFQRFSKQVKIFINICKPQNTVFAQIKKPYRQIIRKTYDIISLNYLKQKNKELAEMGTYITFCLTIDKLYLPKKMLKNFEPYLQKFNIPRKNPVRISYENFRKFIEISTCQELVKYSTDIIHKYYQI